MTIEFLTKANKIIEAGLRAHTPSTGAPHPEQSEPDIEWNSTVGRLEPELDRCVWCCPTTCANCSIEHCSDRLAGGAE